MGVCVYQSALLQVHHQSEMVEEVCPQDWFADLCYNKDPLRSPKLRLSDLVPKVGMGVPLAALSERLSVGSRLSALEGGITLTAAPVSTRYVSPLSLSLMCSRRLLKGPATFVAANGWPASFPETLWSKVVYSFCQTCGDTNRGCRLSHWLRGSCFWRVESEFDFFSW